MKPGHRRTAIAEFVRRSMWPRQNAYWDGGRNNRQSCSSCYVCQNTETPVINLNR